MRYEQKGGQEDKKTGESNASRSVQDWSLHILHLSRLLRDQSSTLDLHLRILRKHGLVLDNRDLGLGQVLNLAVLDLPQLLRDLRDETEVTLWETLALHLLTFGTMLEYLLLTGDFAMSVNALLPYLADRR